MVGMVCSFVLRLENGVLDETMKSCLLQAGPAGAGAGAGVLAIAPRSTGTYVSSTTMPEIKMVFPMPMASPSWP
jgi:hypothetical protein